MTVVGSSVRDAKARGKTVNVVVFVTPPYEAAIVTEVELATGEVAKLMVAVVAPAGTQTPGEYIWAADVLLLERVTLAPPEGAGPDRVTVANAEADQPVQGAGRFTKNTPPVTEVRSSVTEVRVGACPAAGTGALARSDVTVRRIAGIR